MKKFVAVALFTGLALGTSGLAEERTFQIDPVHSSVQFRIRHLYSVFVGRFNKFEGTLSVDPKNPATLKVSASVDITSIDTANADRDKHLLTPDFFAAEHHPAATFVSTNAVLGNTNNSGAVTGTLTIRGIAKEVTFRGSLLGQGVDLKGTNRAGLHATATINRADFGMNYNVALPNGVSVLDNNVELILDLETFESKDAVPPEPKTPAETAAYPAPVRNDSSAINLVVDAIPAAIHANLAAKDFHVNGPAGSEKAAIFSTMPSIAMALDFETTQGYIDVRAGAGLLLNANLSSYMLFGTLGWYHEVKPSIFVGPHIGITYFSAPDWWSGTDIKFDNTTGWLAGLHISAGDKISYLMSIDYLSMAFDVKSRPPGVTTTDDQLDMSGIAVQFGVRVQF